MTTAPHESNNYLSETDDTELDKLVTTLELSDGATIIFAIAPDSSPQHPVVEQFKTLLSGCDENFQIHNFFYSDNSLYNFLYSLDNQANIQQEASRKLIMAFGIDQLPLPRLVREMKQLNLGRESIFNRDIVIIFWLNKSGFLEEFSNRAPDFWDWRNKVVTFSTRPVLNPLLYSYLERLIAENSYLKISGVMQVQRQVDIFLDQIYVSLQAVRRQEVVEIERHELSNYTQRLTIGSSSPHDLDEPCYYDEPVILESSFSSTTKTITQKLDLSEAVRQNQYSVILGAPGAGKTTLLRYLALHFAIAKRDSQEIVIGSEQQELGKTLLPVFFRIADYAERLDKQPNLTLLDYLRQYHTEAEVIARILETMQQGQCLMLLDGLDEVFDQESRRQIVERINQFADEFAGNKFVITSRIAGYRDVQLSSRFAEFTIEDMDSEEVEKFLHRWCRAVEKAQQPEATEEQWQTAGDDQTREILEAIQDNEGVKRLTANPLLVTILALIHRNGARLPNRRVELYALAVKTLIEDWQLSKKLPDAPTVVLKETEVVRLLAPLAYWMHEEKPSGLVTQAEVEEQLAEKLAELNDIEPDTESVRQAVEEFLRKVRETTGLFVERAPGVYGFMHLTFEEYFAARYIADNDQSEILSLIDEHFYEPRWNEPILLALGYYGIHFNAQVDKLLKKLFSKLDTYEPTLQGGDIRIKNASSQEAILVWSNLPYKSETSKLEVKLKDLLFAGDVLTQVEVTNSSIRKKIMQKLVNTLICLDTDFKNDLVKKILRLLRRIESFTQKGEVKLLFQQIANDLTLSEEKRYMAQFASLYIACGKADIELVNYVTNIINNIEPTLFVFILSFVAELGNEIRPALENCLQNHSYEQDSQEKLKFLTAISFITKDKYQQAIAILEQLNEKVDIHFKSYIFWALNACYCINNSEFHIADNYYQKCFAKLAIFSQPSGLRTLWLYRGIYCGSYGIYKQSIEYLNQALAIEKELGNLEYEASILGYIGKAYKEWSEFEQAISHYQQSRHLYEQLELETDVANQWGWISDCYKDWGKYEQAIESRQNYLQIYQRLDNQSNVANAYSQLGRIYQAWGKYEQAISHYQQSCRLYEQLELETDVANQWGWISDCYKDWGKYEQAIESRQNYLQIYQRLDNQSNVANAYSQLGRIYQAWGKYEQALSHYQQSRRLYEQLELEKHVANQWGWISDCYKDWGKYEQAIESQQNYLRIYQRLDNQPNVASAYWQLGRIYQAWGRYEQAIFHYQQSRHLYEQLELETDVANLLGWISNCYRDWGKYEQAIESRQNYLQIYQRLDNQPNIAFAYSRLGYIYQAWCKYEQAISYYQQSRDLYEQLQLETDVADLSGWISICYRDCGKYEQAIESRQNYLKIYQRLDNQLNVANAYSHLGRIYQAWGKYEQAIYYYQQARDIYKQLNREQDVVYLWGLISECYRDWGKYEQAIECLQNCLQMNQRLDNHLDIAFAHLQLGCVYQAWGKYEQAISYYQQSRDIYKQLNREQGVANQWGWMSNCYRNWGKYEQAIECLQNCLQINQRLDNQPGVARAYSAIGHIYQEWDKYEQAISYYQQSSQLYEQLGRELDVANQLYKLADYYLNLKDYNKAIDYYKQSCDLHFSLGDNKSVAIRYRRLAYTQGLLARNLEDTTQAFNLLAQAEQNIYKAMQMNTAGAYTKNLAYDYIALSLLISERLRLLPNNDSSLQEQIAQFEQNYNIGLSYFDELGQTVDKAEEVLDIAHAYLEVGALENLEFAEQLAQESLHVFQEYNRRKLEASAFKLMGEIYLKRRERNQDNAEAIATQFLTESLRIYRALDLQEKASEVEKLLYTSGE